MARETLIPVVVTGRDLRALPERLAATCSAMLQSYGIGPDAVAGEREAMRDAVYIHTHR